MGQSPSLKAAFEALKTSSSRMCSSGPIDVHGTSIFTEGKIEDIAREIAITQTTDAAFFVCDVGDVFRKVELWRLSLPRVTPFYAIKACGDPVVLATLKSLDVNFDCSNKEEINTVLGIGVHPDRIIYANTVKSTSHVVFAEGHGVRLMTFDSCEELYKVTGKKVKLLLRIMGDKQGCLFSFDEKFGCSLDDARNILETARDLDCNVVGVSFHVGCVYKSPEIFARTIEQAREVFDIAAHLGKPMTVLNIGGGFPGGLRNSGKFKQVCSFVRQAIDLHFPPSNGVEIIAEPGQFFVTSAYSLVVKVVGKRKRQLLIDGVPHSHQDVFINESRDNCICRPIYEFTDVQIWPLEEPRTRPRDVLTTLWGASCSTLDCIETRKPLFDVRVDEWLLMDNLGAYSLSFVSGFNGIGFPAVHYVVPPSAAAFVREVCCWSPLRSGYTQPRGVLKETLSARREQRIVHLARTVSFSHILRKTSRTSRKMCERETQTEFLSSTQP